MEDSGVLLFTKKFILVAVVVVLAIHLSGIFNPFVSNACKYAQVSREMLDNNDWINLTIAHEPYEQKPPLLFWLGAIFYSIFGVSEFAFKFPVLLLSLVGIYSTYRFARLFYGSKVAWLASFFWATSVGYFHFNNDIHTDTILADFVILAVWQFSAYFREKKWHQFLVGTCAIGFAMLSKGPVGLAIPIAAVGTHLLVHKKFREIFHARWLLALVLALIIVSPALIGLFNQFGFDGLKFFFWTNNAGRITGSYRSSGSDFTFYFHNLILVTFPWFMFVYPGLILEFRKYILKLFRKEKLTESDELVNIGGFTLFFIVLTIASQKNPHYMLAILPFAFILAAKWAFAIFEGDTFRKLGKTISAVNFVVPLLILPLGLLFLLWLLPEKRIWFWMIFLVGTIALAYSYFKYAGLKRQLAVLLLAQFIFLTGFNLSVFRSMIDFDSTFKACKMFNEQAAPGEKLHSFYLRYWTTFYYSKSYGLWITEEDKLMEVANQKNGDWVYTNKMGIDVLDHYNAKYTVRGEFNFRSITGLTPAFLNPKTRAGKFEKHYLLELGKE